MQEENFERIMNDVAVLARRLSVIEKNLSDAYWGLDSLVVFYAQERQKEAQEAQKVEEARKLVAQADAVKTAAPKAEVAPTEVKPNA